MMLACYAILRPLRHAHGHKTHDGKTLRHPQNQKYTMGHKKRANLFLSVTSSKSTDFNAVFTDRFTNERLMRQYQLHPPHLISVATLPCEL